MTVIVLVQGLQDKQDVAESDMQKGNRELLALKAWGGQIGDLVEAVNEIIEGLDQRAATPGSVHGIGLHEQQLTELTAHFCKVGTPLVGTALVQLWVLALPVFAGGTCAELSKHVFAWCVHIAVCDGFDILLSSDYCMQH